MHKPGRTEDKNSNFQEIIKISVYIFQYPTSPNDTEIFLIQNHSCTAFRNTI